MDESGSLLLVEMVVSVGEDESNGGEEVGFTGSVSANDHVKPRGKRVDFHQVFVRLESLDSDLG